MTINLSKIQNNYIDLIDAPKNVTFTGNYLGDRIVLKNASDKRILFKDGSIESHQKWEETLVFSDDVKNLGLFSENFKLIIGGITFWGSLDTVSISEFNILYPHTGIRANKDVVHNKVIIHDNTIVSPSHEGIYMGVSSDTPRKSSVIDIARNKILTAGWDGIQVGNWHNAHLSDNVISNAGTSERWGQWHAITINPGAKAWVWNNKILSTRHYQVVNATCFFEKPLNLKDEK